MHHDDSGSVPQMVREAHGRPLKSSFRPDIEGLRAVAVLAVVLFHASVPGVPGGYVGVDVFFVISGFLITGLLWREVSSIGTVRMSHFYGARARRLLPAAATVGVVTSIASALLVPSLEAKAVIGDGIASALYVGNYRFVLRGIDYLAAYTLPSPFEHYWSLGVEEQFYLVWPALLLGVTWLVRRRRKRKVGDDSTQSARPYVAVLALVGVLSFMLSLALSHIAASVAFFSLPTRAWELAVGGLVALTATRWRRLTAISAAIAGWTGLASILLACVLLSTTTPYPGTAALLPVLGTALTIGAGCATPSRGCGRVLSVAPMQAIGRLSYSWYLWHWPVLLLVPPLLGHQLGLAGRLTAAILSGVLAVLTTRFIENPIRFNAHLRRSARASLALGGGVTAVAVIVNVVLLVLMPAPVGRGAPVSPMSVTPMPSAVGQNIQQYDDAVQQAFTQVQAAVAEAVRPQPVPSNLDPSLVDAADENLALYQGGCLRNFLEVGQPDCTMGDLASKTTVALVGDSNAAMWRPAFEQVTTQRRWRLETMYKSGCPLMDVPVVNLILRREYTECEQWRDQIIARLRAAPPQLIVLSLWRKYGAQYGFTSGFTSYDPTWIESLSRMVKELRATGATVLMLGPIPDLHSVVPICVSGDLDDATACSQRRSDAVNERGIAAETAAITDGGGQYTDITPLFCTTERCPVIVGNNLVYLDENHLTSEYVRQLAPVIGVIADRALAVK